LNSILIVSYHFEPENVPSVMRAQWFYRHLPSFGYKPEILAATRTLWLRSSVRNEPEIGVHRTPEASILRGWLHLTNLANNLFSMNTQVIDYGLSWLPFGIWKARQIVRALPIRAVVTTQPSIVSTLVGMHLKKAFQLPWIADFQDPLVGNPNIIPHPIGDRWQRWIEKQIFQYADRLIANTDSGAAMWRQRYPEHAHKITVIWNGYDDAEPIPPARPLTRSYRVLSHIGTIYAARHPSALLESYERLVASGKLDPAVLKLRFVGVFDWAAIPNPEQVHRMVRAGHLELENQYIPRPDALREAAEADYLLVLDMNESNSDLQVPCKIYDYLRTGRPILAFTPENSPLERIIQRSGIAHEILYNRLCSADDVDAALLRLVAIPATSRQPDPWFADTHEARSLSRMLAGELDRLV
jgi:glycosyltransferase involved in cell wall biosynthesis